MAEKKYAEAIKAIGMKIALEGNIQGNKPEEKITRMRAEIDKAPAEMKPVMEAVLANWYWHYFQQNRWRFMQRTQTAAAPSDDFTTWDLPRILSEIDKQFQKTLADAEMLKKDSDRRLRRPAGKRKRTDAYRPTLYDVLAHNALEFYSAGEQVGSRAQDAFDLSADSPDLCRRRTNSSPGSRYDRRRLADVESDPTLPRPVALSPGRRRSIGVLGRRSAATGLRQQQGVRRRKDRTLQSGAETVCQ